MSQAFDVGSPNDPIPGLNSPQQGQNQAPPQPGPQSVAPQQQAGNKQADPNEQIDLTEAKPMPDVDPHGPPSEDPPHTLARQLYDGGGQQQQQQQAQTQPPPDIPRAQTLDIPEAQGAGANPPERAEYEPTRVVFSGPGFRLETYYERVDFSDGGTALALSSRISARRSKCEVNETELVDQLGPERGAIWLSMPDESPLQYRIVSFGAEFARRDWGWSEIIFAIKDVYDPSDPGNIKELEND